MKTNISVFMLVIAFASTSFGISAFQGISETTNAATESIACPHGPCKVLVEAKDDAAEFVATGGLVRSAKLQAALGAIREKQPELVASDLELADLILQNY